MTDAFSPEPFCLELPDRQKSCVVFASPHSGSHYPHGFLRQSPLDPLTLRSSEDAFIDLLLQAAPELGAPLMTAVMPRAFVDLNRNCDELDPALVEGVRVAAHNPRIASGLGVIPRVVAGGRVIRPGKMTRREAEQRIAQYWHPYHARLDALLRETRENFGAAVLVDMHSMPHEAISEVRGRRPQVVLGDRFGSTASAGVTQCIEAAFRDAGLEVTRNIPFAGAYMVQAHGRPAHGRHAVQVEIDRALYMNEATVTPNADFASVQRLLEDVMKRLIRDLPEAAQPEAGETSLAAE